MEEKTGVYKIVNKINGKTYYGSAGKSFRHRWGNHKSQLKRNQHHCDHLQKAWNKYGEDIFEFVVILICEKTECFYYEQLILDKYWDTGNTCYNSRRHINGENHNWFGKSHSIESLEKMRISKIGNTHFLGRKHTEESRKKMSIAAMGNTKGAAKGRKIIYNGTTKSLAAWAKEINIKHNTLTARLKSGWTVEETLSIPLLKNSKLLRH